MIRQTANKNVLLKHFEDELYDYSRLRNAIVHNSTSDEAIAEPHTKVVMRMEYILEQLRKPPLVVDVLHQEKILSINASDTLQTFLVSSAEDSFTHMPVYDEGKVVGVMNPKYVTEVLGEEIQRSGYVSKEYLASLTIGRIMGKPSANYIFESVKLTVVQAITYFHDNRRLKAIFVTRDGSTDEPVLRVITATDVMEFQKRIF